MALRRTLNAAMQMVIMDEDDMALAHMGSFFADREQRKRGMFRLDLEIIV